MRNRWFSKEDDGLRQKWHGRVWMNPPYSKPLLGPFVTKLCEELSAGDVSRHHAGEQQYRRRMVSRSRRDSTSHLLTRGRIGFLTDSGEQGSPLQGQAFFYYGMQPEVFADVFNDIGMVVPTEWPT